MQRQPFQNNIRIPYSKWAQHRADNGLIYLAHPVTGEVKWLWSRHNDPKTSNDYLVNTVTGERQWVTMQNDHLCPIQPRATPSSTASTPNNPLTSTNPFSEPSRPPFSASRPQPKPNDQTTRPQNRPANSPYREIAAPKSLGLTADEVLMLVPETGRRYIYNKKTKSSRWLPDRPPDTIPSDGASKGIFFRGRNSKPTPSPFDEESATAEELRKKLTIPGPNDPPKAYMPTPNQTNAAGNTARTSANTNSVPQTAPKRPATGTAAQQGYVRQPPNTASAPIYTPDEAARIVQRALLGGTARNANVLGKLQALTAVVQNVHDITSAGKYDMTRLRAIAEKGAPQEQTEDAAQRLLELGEYLTQQMLKVDGVESAGNNMVRAKRKLGVKTILALTDEVDSLRKKLQAKSR